ncbi:MAG: TonB-dependent receptor, partial [Psychroflexus sp.]|nr:TonB-dependent receptor [Psychroflexus sp.]
TYPADFTGGIVNIQTKDFPAKPTYSISIGTGVNPDMHFQDNYLAYDGGDTDFLGFDDGTRDLPLSRSTVIPNTFEEFPNQEVHPITELTGRFEKQLTPQQQTSNPNFNFNFTAGNQFDIGDDQLGYQFSLSYKNETTFYENRQDGNYIKNQNDDSVLELNANRITTGSEGINNVILNGLAGLVYKRDNSKYKLNLLHIQNGESSAGLYDQQLAEAAGGSGFADLRKDALLYTQRSISNLLLSGKHNFDNRWELEWKVSPSLANNDDKDHRVTILQENQQGQLSVRPNTAGRPIRIWRSLEEVDYISKADVEKKTDILDRPANIKFGGNVALKNRDYAIDDYLFEVVGQSVPDNDPGTLLLPDNIWNPEDDEGTLLTANQPFEPVNSYEGEQRTFAGYGQIDFIPFEKFKTVIGLRFEKFESYYTGKSEGALNDPDTEVFDNDLILDKADLFPSANLIYELTEKSNFRASYSRTTARPSFKEASFVQIFDPIANRRFIGNIELQPTYVNNFDIRYEFFGGEGEMLAAS